MLLLLYIADLEETGVFALLLDNLGLQDNKLLHFRLIESTRREETLENRVHTVSEKRDADHYPEEAIIRNALNNNISYLDKERG